MSNSSEYEQNVQAKAADMVAFLRKHIEELDVTELPINPKRPDDRVLQAVETRLPILGRFTSTVTMLQETEAMESAFSQMSAHLQEQIKRSEIYHRYEARTRVDLDRHFTLLDHQCRDWVTGSLASIMNNTDAWSEKLPRMDESDANKPVYVVGATYGMQLMAGKNDKWVVAYPYGSVELLQFGEGEHMEIVEQRDWSPDILDNALQTNADDEGELNAG